MTRSVVHERAGIPGKLRDFVFVSDFSQQILEPYLPPGARIHRVDNLVDAAKAQPKEFTQDEPFLFVGALAKGKNPQAACRAAAEVHRRVVYVGRGELDSELRQEPNADVRGWQSESDLVSSYRAARALVFVPIWPETQGLVVYEAAAQGLPSIVADDCAAADFVREHDAGLVVPSGSHESLVEAMETLASTEMAARLGANAHHAFWSDPPTLEQHVRQLEVVYVQAIGAKLG
jgi:glycosyltransferase involved in cell wall biosynthesis